MSLDRIRKEEEELEKLMFPKAEEENHSEEETEEPLETGEQEEYTEDENQSTEESVIIESSEDTSYEQEEPEKQKRVSWKKRYTSYKASTDRTIFGLRRELADGKEQAAKLLSDIERLKERVKELEGKDKDMFAGVISQDDEDLLGSEAIEVIRRANEAATKDLREELAELKREKQDRIKREAESARSTATRDLELKLDNLFEDWRSIDEDPKFGEYLKGIDQYSGYTRQALFANAVTTGDVENVARFYRAYSQTLPPTKESILGKKVAPIGGSASSTNDSRSTKKPTYTIAEYEQAYDALNKGSYRSTKEREMLKKKVALLDQAFIEGRITD